MKREILLLILMAILFAFVGCAKEETKVKLEVSIEGNGTIVIGEETITNSKIIEYAVGTELMLVATPNYHNAFDKWTINNVLTLTEAQYPFTINEDTIVVASFTYIEPDPIYKTWYHGNETLTFNEDNTYIFKNENQEVTESGTLSMSDECYGVLTSDGVVSDIELRDDILIYSIVRQNPKEIHDFIYTPEKSNVKIESAYGIWYACYERHICYYAIFPTNRFAFIDGDKHQLLNYGRVDCIDEFALVGNTTFGKCTIDYSDLDKGYLKAVDLIGFEMFPVKKDPNISIYGIW